MHLPDYTLDVIGTGVIGIFRFRKKNGNVSQWSPAFRGTNKKELVDQNRTLSIILSGTHWRPENQHPFLFFALSLGPTVLPNEVVL